MDLESISRWEDYSRAKDAMMVHTDTASSPWFVVESDIKKHARLNMLSHLLSTIPYERGAQPGGGPAHPAGVHVQLRRPPRELATYVPDHASALIAE